MAFCICSFFFSFYLCYNFICVLICSCLSWKKKNLKFQFWLLRFIMFTLWLKLIFILLMFEVKILFDTQHAERPNWLLDSGTRCLINFNDWHGMNLKICRLIRIFHLIKHVMKFYSRQLFGSVLLWNVLFFVCLLLFFHFKADYFQVCYFL